MKKKLIFFLIFVVIVVLPIYSQANNSIDVDDEVYQVLNDAQTKGYCRTLSNYKPYTESYIISALDDIYDYLDGLDETYAVRVEKEVILAQKNRFKHEIKGFDAKTMEYSFQSDYDDFKPTMFVHDYADLFVSGGAYNVSEFNSTGFDLYDRFDIYGQINDFLSYRTSAYIGFSDMPLYQLGDDYVIGSWWKETEFENSNPIRTVNVFRNFSVNPFTYKKPWSGSVYYLTNFTASGLEGWPTELSLAFGMEGELSTSFYDDKLILRLGRYSHDLASMDTNSSLVLNPMAQPFLGLDMHLQLNDFFSFDTVTGWLEFPNQPYINGNAFYDNGGKADGGDKKTDHSRFDSLFFQNLYTVKSMNLDFKYFHFDVGSTCVYPKRFEIGYFFPLIDCVIYQNSLGDYDNLSLFTNVKGIWPGVGQIWISGYLDEMNKPNAKWWENTRCMLALQGGVKANVPWVPFGSVSFRYTKVEPYCYTHTLLAYQPYSQNYTATPYTNNGYSLGYYLQPNSDEFLLDFNCKPTVNSAAGFSYQLTRHGVDWGTGQVEGSNIYSELTYNGRDKLRKYFLHDGTYEWTNTVNFNGSYTINSLSFPIKIQASIGYVWNMFTGVTNAGQKNGSFFVISSDEYKPYNGLVMSLGVSVFCK